MIRKTLEYILKRIKFEWSEAALRKFQSLKAGVSRLVDNGRRTHQLMA